MILSRAPLMMATVPPIGAPCTLSILAKMILISISNCLEAEEISASEVFAPYRKPHDQFSRPELRDGRIFRNQLFDLLQIEVVRIKSV